MAQDVKVRIGADEQVSNESKKAAKALKGLTSEAKKSTADLAKGFAVATAAVYAAGKAYDFVKEKVSELVNEWNRQEVAERKLQSILRSTGNILDTNITQMNDYATSMAYMTGISDEAILNAQGIMLTFTKIGKEVFPRAMETAADMAAVFGGDLNQNVIRLGKALQEPTIGVSALREVGVSFSQAQIDMIKRLEETNQLSEAQTVILKELETQVGGVSRSLQTTNETAFKQFNEALSESKETMGRTMANGIKPFVQGLTDVMTAFTNAAKEGTSFFEEMEKLSERTVARYIESAMSRGLGSFDAITAASETFSMTLNEVSLIAEKFGLIEQSSKSLGDFFGTLNGQTKEISIWQAYFNEYQQRVVEGFALIEQKAKVPGREVDVLAEKQQFLNKLVSEWIEKGALVDSGGWLSQFIQQYETILKYQKEVADPPEVTFYDQVAIEALETIREENEQINALKRVEGEINNAILAGDYERLEVLGKMQQALKDVNAERARERLLQEKASRIEAATQMAASLPGGEILSIQLEMERVTETLNNAINDGLGPQVTGPLRDRLEALGNEMDRATRSPFWNRLEEFGQQAMAAAVNALQQLADWFIGLVTSTQAFQEVMSSVNSLLSMVVTELVGPLLEAARPLISVVILLVQNIATFLVPVINMLGTVIESIMPFIMTLANLFLALMGAISPLIAPILSLLTIIINGLNPILMALIPVFETIGMVLGWLTPVFDALGIAVKVVMTPVAVLGAMFTWAGNMVYNFGNFIKNFLSYPFDSSKWHQGARSLDLGGMISSAVADVWNAPTASGLGSGLQMPGSISAGDLEGINSLVSGPGSGAGGIYGGNTTVQQAPNIEVHIHIGTSIGEDRRRIAETVIDAIDDYIGAGAHVSWLEASTA